MAPVLPRPVANRRVGSLYCTASVRRPGAHETQAAGRHGHFGAKSAPQHRDFAPAKVGVI